MPETFSNALISTDLDGTLLDHYSYSWDAALPSLHFLSENDIPVVINTSKTRDEVIELQKSLNLVAPFIVENGSAVYFPQKESDLTELTFEVKVLGRERQDILNVLANLRTEGFEYESYSDWSVEDLMQRTGLEREKAEQSQRRLFSEPLIWQDDEEKLEAFKTALNQHGLRLIKGGRFYHVLGDSNKGKAIQYVRDVLYSDTSSCKLICLGDSYNDLDMLAIADVAVFCRSPAHDFPEHTLQNSVFYTDGFGPEGWHEAITKIFTTPNE